LSSAVPLNVILGIPSYHGLSIPLLLNVEHSSSFPPNFFLQTLDKFNLVSYSNIPHSQTLAFLAIYVSIQPPEEM
jgi:hypothetical protein